MFILQITLADVLYYGVDEIAVKICPTYLDDLPELKSLVTRVGENENIKRYKASRKY